MKKESKFNKKMSSILSWLFILYVPAGLVLFGVSWLAGHSTAPDAHMYVIEHWHTYLWYPPLLSLVACLMFMGVSGSNR